MQNKITTFYTHCLLFYPYQLAETKAKYVYQYLSEESYKNLQTELLNNPEKGNVIRNSGGVRKVRWSSKGKGKRGGVRVIYYWMKSDHEIWLLTIYNKSDQVTIPGNVLRKIIQEFYDE